MISNLTTHLISNYYDSTLILPKPNEHHEAKLSLKSPLLHLEPRLFICTTRFFLLVALSATSSFNHATHTLTDVFYSSSSQTRTHTFTQSYKGAFSNACARLLILLPRMSTTNCQLWVPHVYPSSSTQQPAFLTTTDCCPTTGDRVGGGRSQTVARARTHARGVLLLVADTSLTRKSERFFCPDFRSGTERLNEHAVSVPESRVPYDFTTVFPLKMFFLFLRRKAWISFLLRPCRTLQRR